MVITESNRSLFKDIPTKTMVLERCEGQEIQPSQAKSGSLQPRKLAQVHIAAAGDHAHATQATLKQTIVCKNRARAGGNR